MDHNRPKITPYFSKLASRLVQSITPAFKALANHVQSAKPVFQRAIQAATTPFSPAPAPQEQTVRVESTPHSGHRPMHPRRS